MTWLTNYLYYLIYEFYGSVIDIIIVFSENEIKNVFISSGKFKDTMPSLPLILYNI